MMIEAAFVMEEACAARCRERGACNGRVGERHALWGSAGETWAVQDCTDKAVALLYKKEHAQRGNSSEGHICKFW